MVGIGGQLGYAVVRFLGLPFMKSWVKIDAENNLSAVMVDERRFGYAKRIGYVLGAAAGIAVAFKAPIGGILYLLQEATVTSWSPELTAKAFICTVLATMTFEQIQVGAGLSIHRLLIFDENPTQDKDWQWADLPYFIVLSAFCGWIAGLWGNGRFYVWTRRRRFQQHMAEKAKFFGTNVRYYKIIEAVAFAAICAVLFGFGPAMVECTKCETFCGETSACAMKFAPIRNITNITSSIHDEHAQHNNRGTHASHAGAFTTTHSMRSTSSASHAGAFTTTPASHQQHNHQRRLSHEPPSTFTSTTSTVGHHNSGGHGNSATSHLNSGSHTGSGHHSSGSHTGSGNHSSGNHAGSGNHTGSGNHSSHGSGHHTGNHTGSGHHTGSHGTGHHTGSHGSSGDHGHHHHCLSYVQYTCPDGQYNEMATLLLTNSEASVQHLFSRGSRTLR